MFFYKCLYEPSCNIAHFTASILAATSSSGATTSPAPFFYDCLLLKEPV